MRSAVNFKVRILLVLFTQVINKNIRMNGSINLDSLTEMSQHFGQAKCRHKKKDRYLVQKHHRFLAELQKTYDPKTMKRHTFPWYKSCKISVLPKIEI